MSKTMKIPDGWEKIKLDSLVNIDCKSLGSKTEQGYTFRYISLSDVKKGVINPDVPVVKFENAPSRARRIVQRGDVLFSTVRPNLEGYARINVFEENLIASTGFAVLSPAAEDDTEFIYQYLYSYHIKKQIYALVVGSNYPAVNSSDVAHLRLIVPESLIERKTIVGVLSVWDEGIEKITKLIALKEKKLDGYACNLFQRKKINSFPGWKSVALNKILLEHSDQSTGTEEVFSVSVHKGLINQIEHLGRSFAASNTEKYNRVHYGDIVYTKSPTGNFPLGIVKQSYIEKDVIVSPLYGVFTPKTFNLGVILNFYFSSPQRARNYLFPIIQKGAKNTIAMTNKTFMSKTLYLPEDETDQKSIAEYVITAQKEIDLLKKIADKYKEQKKGLMQKLLTGEWRVGA